MDAELLRHAACFDGSTDRRCGYGTSVPRRVLLAVNERARRGRDACRSAAAALRVRGHEVREVALSGRTGELSEAIRAHRDDVDAVVVGGGDGTLLTALDGLIDAKLPLVILPLGTFNELARTLAIPDDPAAVAALVDDGVPLPLDVGCVNGRHYLNEASVGLSTRVARLQTGSVKSRLGMFAIPVTTLRALHWMRPLHLEIEDEDGTRRRVRAVQLTVANSYRFGGVVENPDGSLEDGRLWLYSVDVRGTWDALRVLGAIALRRFPHATNVFARPGRRFVVRSLHAHRHRVLADSEHVAHLPAEFSIVPRALTVMVPERTVRIVR
jgi:YegS/Rv2252/BmrU family lipid kinase